MSTQINVIVDDGGLSNKAKQQTQANRWGKLEADASAVAERKGRKQRDDNRAQQGLTPTGQSESGYRAKARYSPDEVAANRRPPQGLGHAWVFTDPPSLIANAGAFYQSDLASGQTWNFNSAAVLDTGRAVESACDAYLSPGSGSLPSYQKTMFELSGFVTAPTGSPGAGSASTGYPHYVRLGSDSSIERDLAILPTGNGNFILALCSRAAWVTIDATFRVNLPGESLPLGIRYFVRSNNPTPSGITLATGKSRSVDFYACNNKQMRLIQPNANVLSLFLAAWPEPTRTAEYILNNFFEGNYSQVLYQDTYYEIPPSRLGYFAEEEVESYTGIIQPLDVNASGAADKAFNVTPAVFSLLNTISPFTDVENIKTFPTSKRWVIPDRTAGSAFHAFALRELDPNTVPPVSWLDLYNGADPFRYQRWTTPNQEPAVGSIGVPFPAATLRLDASRPSRSGFYQNRIFGTMWDWDDPNYCRQMCLALGFDAADLTP